MIKCNVGHNEYWASDSIDFFINNRNRRVELALLESSIFFDVYKNNIRISKMINFSCVEEMFK